MAHGRLKWPLALSQFDLQVWLERVHVALPGSTARLSPTCPYFGFFLTSASRCVYSESISFLQSVLGSLFDQLSHIVHLQFISSGAHLDLQNRCRISLHGDRVGRNAGGRRVSFGLSDRDAHAGPLHLRIVCISGYWRGLWLAVCLRTVWDGDARFVRPSAANRLERLALGLIVRFRHGT